MKYILIDAGFRGMRYAQCARDLGIEITAVAEFRPERLIHAGETLQIAPEMRFREASDLLALGKIAVLAIVSTMDRDHFSRMMQAPDCGCSLPGTDGSTTKRGPSYRSLRPHLLHKKTGLHGEAGFLTLFAAFQYCGW